VDIGHGWILFWTCVSHGNGRLFLLLGAPLGLLLDPKGPQAFSQEALILCIYVR
jgi:hypothetical protein